MPRDSPFTPVIDTRYYVLDNFLVGYNYLMRHENLVAKVYVGGGQGEVDESTAATIAQAAAGRMMASLAARKNLPTVDELLAHIPDSLQACAPSSSTEGTPLGYGEVARVDCDPNDHASIEFQLFRTVQDMDGAFAELRGDALEKDTTWTPDGCAAGWYDDAWTLGDQEAGRLVCTTPEEAPALFIWTHPESRVRLAGAGRRRRCRGLRPLDGGWTQVGLSVPVSCGTHRPRRRGTYSRCLRTRPVLRSPRHG